MFLISDHSLCLKACITWTWNSTK